MSIYAILASKPHNPHYLNRYIRFIESCQKVNENYTGYTEKHHICPKAKDLFPEYKSFSKYPWNLAVLTARQHFIAHWILWKAYPCNQSMMFAFWQMSSTKNTKPDSRTYEVLREECSKYVSMLNDRRVENGTHNLLGPETNRKRVENGTHNFLGGEIVRKRVEDGTHHFLGGEIARKRVEEGTHNWLDKEAARKRALKRVENGTHHFLGGEIQRKNNKRRVENGTHHFLGGEIQRKRIEDGTHHFLDRKAASERSKRRVEDGSHHCLGVVNCYDKNGNFIRIPKELYYKQTGPMEERDFVHFNTKEGKRRKLLSSKVKI